MKVNKLFAPITITLENPEEREWLLTVLSVFAQHEDAKSHKSFKGWNKDDGQRAKDLYTKLDL
jgi:hypothetical protein